MDLQKHSMLPDGKYEFREIEEVSYLPVQDGMPYAGDLYFKKIDHPEFNFPDGIEGVFMQQLRQLLLT